MLMLSAAHSYFLSGTFCFYLSCKNRHTAAKKANYIILLNFDNTTLTSTEYLK